MLNVEHFCDRHFPSIFVCSGRERERQRNRARKEDNPSIERILQRMNCDALKTFDGRM